MSHTQNTSHALGVRELFWDRKWEESVSFGGRAGRGS